MADISRRSFLKTGTAAALGLSMIPGKVFADSEKRAPAPLNRKLKILGVGIGGRGASVLRGLETEEIIGLCDVDWKYAAHIFERYPNAKRYKDWRVMFDEMLDEADAVMVATADHTHAIIAANAIMAGKHVYCEKPLTRTVYESRLLTKLAAKYRVATQMGNQGASGEGVRKICDWIWNGEIGEVTRVEAFTDRPIWPQGLERPAKAEKVPKTLDWDLFLGPAPYRPYHSIYTPWNFRGWWDFGTGALGDMACHILHPVFKALKLGYPTKVQGSSTALLTESCPQAEKVRFVFPARDNMPKVAMPEVVVTWTDGGILPDRPEGLPAGKNLNDSGGAVIFYGTKDTLICGCYGSDFAEAGPFNEMVAMGVVAVRLQGLNQELEWDGENMRFTNIPAGATIKTMIHDGFSITDGHPTFENVYTDPVDANQFARELIKPVFREGWKLPEMP